MTTIKFTAEIEPRPMPRPRFALGRTYAPKSIVEYKIMIKSAAMSAMKGNEPLTGELFCRMKFYRRFKSTSKRFGDADNLFKAVSDACNGVCYSDDAQLTAVTIEKHSDRNFPRVEVEIIERRD